MGKIGGIIAKIIRYLKENPASGFVLVFMILLSIAALFLILEKKDIAEGIANWGFYSLIIGVILRIIEFKRSTRDKGA